MKAEDYLHTDIECFKCDKMINVKEDGGLVKLSYNLVSRLREENVIRFYHLKCFKELKLND